VTNDIALLRAELRDALRETLPELVPSAPPASLDPDELAAALVRRLPPSDTGMSREAIETLRRQVAGLGEHVQRLGDEQRGFAGYLRREDRERGWGQLAVAALVGLGVAYSGLLALPHRWAGHLVGAPTPLRSLVRDPVEQRRDRADVLCAARSPVREERLAVPEAIPPDPELAGRLQRAPPFPNSRTG
jgi:hypothetical protein